MWNKDVDRKECINGLFITIGTDINKLINTLLIIDATLLLNTNIWEYGQSINNNIIIYFNIHL